MIFVPRNKDNTEKEIEDIILLSSFPRDPDARTEFLNRLNQTGFLTQLAFLRRFMLWILKNHFHILLDFYIEGNVISNKIIKTQYNNEIHVHLQTEER